MAGEIPVSVVVATKDEDARITACLGALKDFAQVVVLDSHSRDRTGEIARESGAEIVLYAWDGRYPKKRQWALEHLDLKHDWVFFVDADEIVTGALAAELRGLFARGVERYAGFFVRGRYVWEDKILRYGMTNNKLALLDRRKVAFPVVDDLDIEGMGEIEGHYQPVLKDGVRGAKIGQVRAALIHDAYGDTGRWAARHARYAHWEAEMTRKCAWPKDPVYARELAKRVLRTSAFRPYVIFLYSYVWKLGFLDGRAGWAFAKSRFKYVRMILWITPQRPTQRFLYGNRK